MVGQPMQGFGSLSKVIFGKAKESIYWWRWRMVNIRGTHLNSSNHFLRNRQVSSMHMAKKIR